MTELPLRFGPFTLDRARRELRRDGAVVELNARYFDALCLLAAAPGALVTKDRFMAEVWAGIPVTDEALTQCIRTLRRALGDDAAAPRYIATVPKYGYRFVAAVGWAEVAAAAAPLAPLVMAGALGGLGAGAVGGLAYGLVATALLPAGAMGGASALLVLLLLSVGIGTLGAAAVALGVALAQRRLPGSGAALALGGAAGGLGIGALTELVGTDAFLLLIGSAPIQMTGASEGALIGGATGLSLALAPRLPPRLRSAGAALLGGLAGVLATLAGGRLFAGSLAALGERFAGARLDLAPIGALFGESGFGPLAQAVSAFVEGAVFVGLVCLAMQRVSAAARP